MTKHTKGPWRIGDFGQTVFGPKTEEPAPVTIAYMAKPSPRVNIAERKANTKLIAAAPDLLAACKAAVEEVLSRDYDGSVSMSTLNDMKAAIAKAVDNE